MKKEKLYKIYHIGMFNELYLVKLNINLKWEGGNSSKP